jgi:hypothetical protein
MTGLFEQQPATGGEASKRRRRALWLACLVVLALLPAGAVVWNSSRSGHKADRGEISGDGEGTREEDPNASTGCGSSSIWDVKIGADAQATQVNLTPVPTDVATLTHAPTNTSHRNSFELKTYKVTATLTRVYQEHDLDQHMSIRDSSGNFMLAELPDMSCASGSHWATQLNNAHAQLAAWSGGTPTTVQITGVGFFDGATGQSDQAPNQVELHPVLDINFNPGGPAAGSITGAVVDSRFGPVNGASVSTNPPTSTAVTNASGQYTLAGVAPGTYTVTASAPKFDVRSTGGVTVAAGGSTTANFALSPTPLPAARGASYWPGWDIARGVALLPDESGGYVLDGFGALHPFGAVGSAPPPVVEGPYWPGWDIARGVALLPNGSGGYVVDGFGGLHPFRVRGRAAPPKVTGTSYWPGWDIARGVTLLPNGSGYVGDGFGGLHPVRGPGADAPGAAGSYWPGWDIARGIDATGAHGGYLVDGFGGVHGWATAGAGAPRDPQGGPYWPGWVIARGIAGAGTGPGPVRGYVLDGYGGLAPVALWPAP